MSTPFFHYYSKTLEPSLTLPFLLQLTSNQSGNSFGSTFKTSPESDPLSSRPAALPPPPPLLVSQLDYCDSLPTRLPAQLPLPPSVCSQHSNHSDRGKAYVSSCHSFVLLLFSYFSLQVAAWPPLSTPVLVIYCWVTNYCQPSNLNNTHLFFYSLSESGIWTLLSCLLCSGYHKAAVKVLPGLYPYLEACIEKDWLPSPFGSPAEFISL